MHSEFDIGIAVIPAYTLFSVLGWYFMCLYYNEHFEEFKMSFRKFLLLIGVLVLGTGLGSKLLFILTKIPDVIANFSWGYLGETIWTAGFVFYGGLGGALITTAIFSKFNQELTFKELSGLLVPGFALFHAFGRVGCFFSGCCYGCLSSWGFPLEGETQLRIPVQLMEALVEIVLFVILTKIKDKRLEFYLVAYGIARFVLEFFRGDELRGIWFSISTSQWISIAVVTIVLVREFRGRALVK